MRILIVSEDYTMHWKYLAPCLAHSKCSWNVKLCYWIDIEMLFTEAIDYDKIEEMFTFTKFSTGYDRTNEDWFNLQIILSSNISNSTLCFFFNFTSYHSQYGASSSCNVITLLSAANIFLFHSPQMPMPPPSYQFLLKISSKTWLRTHLLHNFLDQPACSTHPNCDDCSLWANLRMLSFWNQEQTIYIHKHTTQIQIYKILRLCLRCVCLHK